MPSWPIGAPPFIEDAEQARLACLAAVDMIGRVAKLRKDLPELLGVRAIPADCDIRIGIATGEALVGSIGSEFMMSFTVMGDTVNLASRLEGANKFYGSHCLISEATAKACGDAIELREIDRVVAIGQTHAETVYEIMGRKGELTPGADRGAKPLCRGACGLPCAALGRRGSRVRGGAGRRPRRWCRACADGAHSCLQGQPAGRGLGRRLASRAEVGAALA